MAIPKDLKKVGRGEYLYRGFRLIGCDSRRHVDTLKWQIVPYKKTIDGVDPGDCWDNEFNLKRAMERIDRFYEQGR